MTIPHVERIPMSWPLQYPQIQSNTGSTCGLAIILHPQTSCHPAQFITFAGDFHAATAVIDIFDGISDHHHFPLLFLHVLDLGRISSGVAGGISGGVAAGVAAGVDLGHREELLEGFILLCQVGFRQRLPEPVIVVSSPVMCSTCFNKHVGIKATQVTATRSTSYRSLKKMGTGWAQKTPNSTIR